MKTLVAVLMLVMLHLCLIIHCVAEHGNHTNVKFDFGKTKNANLKIPLIREYFFLSLTKNTIFLFFFH